MWIKTTLRTIQIKKCIIRFFLVGNYNNFLQVVFFGMTVTTILNSFFGNLTELPKKKVAQYNLWVDDSLNWMNFILQFVWNTPVHLSHDSSTSTFHLALFASCCHMRISFFVWIKFFSVIIINDIFMTLFFLFDLIIIMCTLIFRESSSVQFFSLHFLFLDLGGKLLLKCKFKIYGKKIITLMSF